MTDSFGEIFAPGLAHLNREKERQRNDIHQLVVDAPPWDRELDEGRFTIHLAAEQPPDEGSVAPGSQSV
jgi:hypothetical protein